MGALSEEIRMVAQTAERFARSELASRPNEESLGFPEKLLRSSAEIGLLHCAAPEAVGGVELDLLGQTLLLGELAEGSAGFAAIISTHLAGTTAAATLGEKVLSEVLDIDGSSKLIGLAPALTHV